MVMHRLLAQQIRENEPLPWNVYDSSSNLLLRKGFVIDKTLQLENLIERGMYVDLSSVKESLSQDSPANHHFDPWQLWDDIQMKLSHVLAQQTKGQFADQIRELADLVRLLSERSSDLALAAIMLMQHGKYPIIHSLHCAVMADMIAKRLDWTQQERQSLCCAALTMNIAMIELQQTLYNQIEPLTTDQQLAIKNHPEQGFRMLHALGVNDAVWLRTVMEHHEQFDGKGYPRGLNSPLQTALLLHTVDVFCAKVSPRAHRKPMLASDASRIMFQTEGHNQTNPYPACLIKQVGIYPPGSFVKLSNGELGVVFKRGDNANTPLVYSLVNAHGLPLGTPLQRDASKQAHHVIAVVPRSNVMVTLDPRTIWKPPAT